MRPLAAAALVALLVLVPGAGAQTLVQPVTGAFTDVYVITGRAVDSRGEPAAGADLTIEIQQPGIRASPLRATANCKGDFITSFNLRDASPRGSVTVTLHGVEGIPDAKASEPFDPFFRRNDVVVQLQGHWNYRCEEKDDVWASALSVTGRIVNRTDAYRDDNVTYHAVPYKGLARLRYEDPQGNQQCPPVPNGPPDACDFLRIDERGDFRYTFVFLDPTEAKGRMHVILDDHIYSAEVDPLTRQAVLAIEATGRGAPRDETPLDVLPLLAAGAALAALLARRARRR